MSQRNPKCGSGVEIEMTICSKFGCVEMTEMKGRCERKISGAGDATERRSVWSRRLETGTSRDCNV